MSLLVTRWHHYSITYRSGFLLKHSASKQNMFLWGNSPWDNLEVRGRGLALEWMVARMKNSRILFLHCKSTKPQLLNIFLLYFYILYLGLHLCALNCIFRPSNSERRGDQNIYTIFLILPIFNLSVFLGILFPHCHSFQYSYSLLQVVSPWFCS